MPKATYTCCKQFMLDDGAGGHISIIKHELHAASCAWLHAPQEASWRSLSLLLLRHTVAQSFLLPLCIAVMM